MALSRRIRRLGLAVLALIAVVLGVGAWLLRVDDIPDELPPIQGDPSAIVIPPVGTEPPLELAQLTGKTTFFVVVGPQTGESTEGQALNRALNRWILPAQVTGYIVGDAEGFGVFRERVEKMMGHFRTEMRYPLYVDFEGVFVRTFALPKGHHGFVVLGPDGTVLDRRSGGAEGDELERIRELLGAREPEPGPPAPSFAAGALDNTSCGGDTPCVLAFLARPVARADVPGIPDGFDGEEDEHAERMRDPSIRLVSTAFKAKLEGPRGLMVGALHDLELPTGWHRVDDDTELRTTFGIAADEAALVVIDREGRLAVVERGLVPIYKWGRVADILGVELDDRRAKDK